MTATAPFPVDERALTIEELIALCRDACVGIGADGERGAVSRPLRPSFDGAPCVDWGSLAGGRPDDDPALQGEGL